MLTAEMNICVSSFSRSKQSIAKIIYAILVYVFHNTEGRMTLVSFN